MMTEPETLSYLKLIDEDLGPENKPLINVLPIISGEGVALVLESLKVVLSQTQSVAVKVQVVTPRLKIIAADTCHLPGGKTMVLPV